MRIFLIVFLSVFVSGCLQPQNTGAPIFKKASMAPSQFKQSFVGECEDAVANSLSSLPEILRISGSHGYGSWASDVKEAGGSIEGDLYGSMIISSMDIIKIDGETLIGYSDITHRDHKCFAYFEVPGVLDQSASVYPALAKKHSVQPPNVVHVKMPNMSLQKAKNMCVDLGVKPATQDFGSCVIYFVYQGS